MYESITPPPFWSGFVHDTTASPFPGAPCTDLGDEGVEIDAGAGPADSAIKLNAAAATITE